MSTQILARIFFAAVLLLGHPAYSSQPAEHIRFKLLNRYPIGGEGKWDLLTFDAKRHRLFISRSSHVQVIDADSGKIVGDIPDTEGVHGIALADELNIGFTSNGKSNSVTVFDLSTLKTLIFPAWIRMKSFLNPIQNMCTPSMDIPKTLLL